ncbi:hypothetical protein CFOL_v3_29820 [Cephalotus follicularis]|uniref:Retropepsins domain-containing protein n=1 Tax=Cephalotus follicularis TaxID=3775 RepID=A0A1Q3D1N5_CEPFO|nr:hypothetical protein CFOL_v3_29820 [Cephalotus follicularis]
MIYKKKLNILNKNYKSLNKETKKQSIHLEQILLQKHSSFSSFDKEIEPNDPINLEIQEETSTKFINLIERKTYQKWHINITIVIQDSFKLQTVALIDSGKTLSMFKEHSMNLIKTKENHLYFMKQEISNKRLEEQLQTSQIQEKIISLKINITNNFCLDLPDAFWHRKCHVVSLPYEKDFSERNIHTKARPIQMTYELMEHCKKEIEELLTKKLIRPSKSPWRCESFYVNKNSEIERGTPRLVINYKPLNTALQWIRHPILLKVRILANTNSRK